MAQNPVVTITMENGDVITAELYPDVAPVSVNNFISLIKKGFYEKYGIAFDDFMLADLPGTANEQEDLPIHHFTEFFILNNFITAKKHPWKTNIT